MSLRLKLVLALVALSTAATAAIGLFSYRTTEQQLEEQIDRSLVEATRRLAERPEPPPVGIDERDDRRGLRGETDVVVQLLGPDGDTISYQGDALPVDDVDLQIARADRALSINRDVTVGDDRYRMLTAGTGDGLGAVQTARSLSTRLLTGITLYKPSELVISARAGTPLAEIEAALAEKGQQIIAEPPDFRALFGTSPYRYLTLRRLDQVRRLLLGAISPSEAALIAGFADQSHMSRQFKQAYGLSPGHWLRLIRQS